MPVNYTIKQSILMLLCGLVFSAGMAFLVNFILSGPKLGLHYDFLLSYKLPAPVSQEILIIDTGEFADSSEVFSVLIALIEMEASNLILTGRFSPVSPPVSISEAEIRRRFYDEYILLGTNIRNLFDAIRSGSVSPLQAPGYVERLLSMTDEGRDRLLTALIDKDEDLLRAITVFGGFLETSQETSFDWDGKLRRVMPVDISCSSEHPVYRILKQRYAASRIETAGQGLILWLLNYDGEEKDINLDKNGNIITPWNALRRVNHSLFKEYDEADRAMRAVLADANEHGLFSGTPAESSPLIFYDYALMLRTEMLKNPDNENKISWQNARREYFRTLEEFINGNAENLLVKGYNEVIYDENIVNTGTLAALVRMRDELSLLFVQMREAYDNLKKLRDELYTELVLSFCIMGPEKHADYSALLANVLITNNHIKPADDKYTLIWSIAAASAVLLLVFMLQPVIQLICGSCLSILASVAFGCVFIFYSYWMDPLVVLSSSLSGTLIIFYLKCTFLKLRTRRFRNAYGSSVSRNLLKELIISGKPRLSEINAVSAAVIAIKDINLLTREDREKTEEAGKLKMMFFSSVKEAVFAHGAVIAGFEGDTVLACFGSPLDKTPDPLIKACEFLSELISNEKIHWRFGMDFGDCTFCWTSETGFSVNGRPAVRARMLAAKTTRLKSRALITDSVREKMNFDLKKIDALYGNAEPVFEFVKS